jgi:hypothetical protein
MDATVFFKSADGVKAVKLPAGEALQATRRWPHEWSLTRYGFAEPPAGWQPSADDGGGRGRVQGASVKAD